MHQTKTKKLLSTREIVLIGMLSALSYVLMLVHPPFKFLGFLEIEVSDVPAIVAGFAYGPLAGIIIELIKNLIKVLTASTTGGVGELANFLISISYVVPASILYRKLKIKHKMLITVSISTLCFVVGGIAVNYFITVPLYCSLYGFDAVIGMASKAVPSIKDATSLILLGITPFNLLKGIMMSMLGALLYEPFYDINKRI